MKDVRCFKGEQSIEIRPITLLVGENSGGKTTALGCYYTLLNFFSQRVLDFNVKPFEMGSFADIMRKEKNAKKEFMISVNNDFGSDIINYQFTFVQNEGDTALRNITIKFSSGGSIIYAYHNKNKGKKSTDFLVQKTPGNFLFEYYDMENSNAIEYLLLKIMPSIKQLTEEGRNKDILSFKEFIEDKIKLITGNQKTPSIFDVIDTTKKCLSPAENFIGISPIRSEPKRTYHPFSGQAKLEGDEVPLFMRRLMRTHKEVWEYLHRELVKFGKSSGMFKDIRIRTFNDDMGDPFQIQIKHAEYYVNIMDVGYGVSQILPILVSMIMAKYHMENKHSKLPEFFNPDISTRFLLQEPGMHLHPQAQAAIGSLMAHFAKTKNGKGHSFLVETHDDFIVDRIRMEIRKGKIAPENVSLVYHEMKKDRVQLHNISFDKEGNLLNVPNSYRKFFMKEAGALLGF